MSNNTKTIINLNVVEMDKGAFASRLGDAHELIVTGILMRLGLEVSVVSVKGGPYDLLIRTFTKPDKSETEIIKAQVKTIGTNRDDTRSTSISFVAGIRAGKNRTYKSDVKKYKYTTQHNDIIIGFDKLTMDLYLLPTRYVGDFGESKSIGRLQPLKNNWDIFLNWNDDYLEELKRELPDFRAS